MFFPVPPYDSHLEDKFEYFYRPYNYEANTKKYISYESENDPPGRINPFRVYQEILQEEETNFIEIYLNSLGKRSQSEPQREMQKELLELQMQEQNEEVIETDGACLLFDKTEKARKKWKLMRDFLVRDDPRVTFFVMNQLRFLTGQN